MYVINLDEKKLYEFNGEKYVEDIMDDMFLEYFERIYPETTARELRDDIWENVEIQIPEYEIFLKKDKMLYYIDRVENTDEDEYEDEFVWFEIAPRCFFKIKKDAHKVLKECFEECNEKFARTMQNITSETGWKSTAFTMMNLRFYKEGPEYKEWKCEDLKENLRDKQKNFEKFARVCLKGRLCEEVVSKILKKYRNILLKNNPIIFITNANTEEIYSVDKDLVAKKISFFSIQEYLEEIIGEILPRDYDFLVNRIYNYIIFPKEGIPAQMRIKKVNKNGLSGVFYGEEETFPIVRTKDGKYFTIITIKPNEEIRTVERRFGSISIESSDMYRGEFIKIDKDFIPEYGYIEIVGKKYGIMYADYIPYRTFTSKFNYVYLWENGKRKDIFDLKYDYTIVSPNDEKVKKFYEEQRNCIHYAFFKLTFKS